MSSSIINGVTSSNTLQRVLVDSSGHLQVDVLTGAGGTQFAGGATLATTGTGTALIGRFDDGGSGAAKLVSVDTDGHLQVDILSSALSTGAATAANQSTANGHLSTIASEIATADTSLATIAGAVIGSEMQVDIVTSALPSGAASASNQTAVQLVHDSAISDLTSQSGTMLMGVAGSISDVANGDGCLLSCSTAGVLNTKLSDVTSGTFTLTNGITANTGASGVTLPADSSDGLDIRAKSGKLTIFGSISGFTNIGGDGYNNIQLFGSLSSISDNSTYTDLSSTFEIYVDSDGKFGTTIDILMPYLKFNTVNEQGSTRTLLLNYVYN